MEDWGFYPHAPFTALSSKTFCEEYPGRFSDSRISLLLAPSHPALCAGQWPMTSFVPDYSGGPVPDFSPQDGNHGVPFTWISPPLRPF